MILEETIKKLLEMKMHAMADALRELVSKPPGHSLSFEELRSDGKDPSLRSDRRPGVRNAGPSAAGTGARVERNTQASLRADFSAVLAAAPTELAACSA